jgi:hypothetical protein
VRFKEFTEDDLGFTVRIGIGRIKGLPVSHQSTCKYPGTHVDSLVISVFELSDSFIVIGNHPILS